jgi:hypothetical protein
MEKRRRRRRRRSRRSKNYQTSQCHASEYCHMTAKCWNGASRGGGEKGTQRPGVQLCYPVPGGYTCKYEGLALQVGGVSDETVE